MKNNTSKVFEKHSVILLIFLSIITFGIYLLYWYWRQRDVLGHNKKILNVIFILLGFIAFLNALKFISGNFAIPIPNYFLKILNYGDYIYIFSLVYFALKIRSRIIKETSETSTKKPSIVLTLVLNYIYLQNEIN